MTNHNSPSSPQQTKADQTQPPGAVGTPAASQQPSFPVVALGASAGGLDALSRFFAELPADSGMAFVVVQHLSPTQASLLSDILGKAAHLSVVEAEDGVLLRPEHAYVIPPNRYLTVAQGRLRLEEPEGSSHPHLSIDRLFLTLAEQLRERAVAVVLSGTGTDGAEGIRAVKSRGGLTIAQDPSSAQHPGMPERAIATGSVDLTLPPESMGKELIRYMRQREQAADGELDMGHDERAQWLAPILRLLHEVKGHDFSQYKTKTIMRRIGRRMAVHNMDNIADYAQFLSDNPAEAATLFQEFLIRVTSFFRDPAAFDVLGKVVIPAIVNGAESNDTVRIWVPGCSTGEEAYSIAMLLDEQTAGRSGHLRIQIFATDIDSAALDIARAGFYPASIAEDLTPERLRRFFKKRDGGYQVNKTLRDMLVFAEQSLIKDPPFSRMDLVSCRNLLIYIRPAMQKRVLALLHYALKPNGVLFLGTSETVGGASDLFEPLRKDTNIYRRLNVAPSRGRGMDQLFLPDPLTLARRSAGAVSDDSLELPRLVETVLVRDHTPPCVVVNANNEIVYFHGHTGRFLEPPAGRPTTDIAKMARPGLGSALRTALHQARSRNQVFHTGAGSSEGLVRITARPLRETGMPEGMVMILVQEVESEHSESVTHYRADGDTSAQYETLQLELYQTKEALQATIEELETSNEELQSSNEELQSSNEELQSSNEELETSREELQSVNEELHTVNGELEHKVEELSRINDDMNNLLASTAIGMIFLDRDLKVQRFTPAVTGIVPLIQGDIGRPLANISHDLEYDHLVEDLESVLANLVQCEREVRTHHDQWYLLRMRPYHTADNRVGGAVVAFRNITDTVRLRATQKLTRALEICPLMAIIVDTSARLEYANTAFINRTGLSLAPGERPTLAELALEAEDQESWKERWPALLGGGSWSGAMKLTLNDKAVQKISTNASGIATDLETISHVVLYMSPAES